MLCWRRPTLTYAHYNGVQWPIVVRELDAGGLRFDS